jgi:hypothetical protein
MVRFALMVLTPMVQGGTLMVYVGNEAGSEVWGMRARVVAQGEACAMREVQAEGLGCTSGARNASSEHTAKEAQGGGAGAGITGCGFPWRQAAAQEFPEAWVEGVVARILLSFNRARVIILIGQKTS